MHRRDLLKAGLASGVALPAAAAPLQEPAADKAGASPAFQLKYGPHAGTFSALSGGDVVEQIAFAADNGFRAWEDNSMAGRPPEEQERIAAALQKHNMTMGVFVANFGTAFRKRSFSTASEEFRENFLADLRKSVEVAKRVNAKWMTIVLGDKEPRLELEYQHANAIDMLRRGAEIFEPEGLIMVMEPLNPWRDHPGMLLAGSPQAYMLCKAVNSPAVKILFDIYHQQIAEGNLIPNIDRCWDEIAYFQIGDNPGRKEPGTGEINYRNVFRHIHSKGYEGVLGMEHGQSEAGEAGQRKVLEAYREADRF